MWLCIVAVCLELIIVLFLFFCEQKTAYEVRISDWSSDVCSSDLQGLALVVGVLARHAQALLKAAQVEVGARDLAHDRHLRRLEIRGAGRGAGAIGLDRKSVA